MQQIELLKEKRSDLLKVDPRTVRVMDNFNVREDYGDIEGLAQSLKANGMRVAARGYRKDGEIYLINGHRRLKAAMLLAEQGIIIEFVIQLERNPTERQMLLDMYIGNDGKSFTPIEEATFVLRLKNTGLKGKEIAPLIGKTEAHVSNLLKLAELPQQIQNQIQNNKISATLVLDMLKSDKGITHDELVNEVENLVKQSGGTKVRKAAVEKAKGNYNSMSLLKKVVTNNIVTHADEDKREIISFLRLCFQGKKSEEKIMEFFGFPKE